MTNKYDWQNDKSVSYYYRISDGKIMGAVWVQALQDVITLAKIYQDVIPYTDMNEQWLGRFVNSTHARQAVEQYWLKDSNTLTWENVDEMDS
jgi:hypothetical protein